MSSIISFKIGLDTHYVYYGVCNNIDCIIATLNCDRFPTNGIIKSENKVLGISNQKEIEALNGYKELEVIIPPQDPITIIISVILTVATTLLLAPKIPNSASRNIPESSPNNGLSARRNEPRLGARRPSIYGTVNAVPDLLVLPYRVFNDAGREIEYNYMLVSEGTVFGSIFKDGSTQIKHITGSTVELYHPNNSPLIGSPVTVVGVPITEPFIAPSKSSAINGQVLKPPNKVAVTDQIKLLSPNQVLFKSADDLTDKYDIGESLYIDRSVLGGTKFGHIGSINGNDVTFYDITVASLPSYITVGAQLYAENDGYTDYSIVTITGITEIDQVTPGTGGDPDTHIFHAKISLSSPLQAFTPAPTITDDGQGGTISTPNDLYVIVGASLTNLGGEHIIESVIDNKITLVDPNWVSINEDYATRTVSAEGARWTDYVVLDDASLEGVICNLTASSMYKDNGKNQYRSTVEVTIGITPIDESDNQTGADVLHTITMKGSATVRDSVNATLRASFDGRCKVRAHRSSLKDTAFDGQVVDDVKWKDLYSFQHIGNHDIDNTRIRTATLATEGALSLKERKLTIEDATRMLQRYDNGTFTTELYPTRSAFDAIVAITFDKYIGRRTLEDINLDGVHAVIEDIKAYFNDDSAADFSYTLDSSDLTYEDTIAMIAHAIYCRAYRRGLEINLSFEKKQSTSTLLFNHRNKIPQSETRQITFGIRDNKDGAVCKWIDKSGIERVVSVPATNLLNPIEIPLLGLNELQATKHAWRAWNKALYQNTFTEFTALSEAALCVLDQRILVADNTTSKTYDGDVLVQSGLELTLSQDVTDTGWIHLQLPTSDLQAVKYTRQSENKILLNNPLITELSTSPQNYARATYLISEESTEEQAFLLLEKSGDKEFNLKFGNYDDRFYNND